MATVIKMNLDGTILGTMGMNEAISGIVTDKYTTVLANEDGKAFHSQSLNIPVPVVVMTNKYDHISSIIRDMHKSSKVDTPVSRRAILFRDRHVCCYCGSSNGYTIDHIIPQSKGGTSTWKNLVACCEECNSKKANHDLEKTGYTQLYQSRKPESYEVALSSTNIRKWDELYKVIETLKNEAIIR